MINIKVGDLVCQKYSKNSMGIIMSEPYKFNKSAHMIRDEKEWSNGFIEVYWIKHEYSVIVGKIIEHVIGDLLIIKDN